MLQESAKLYVSDPYEFPFSALRVCPLGLSTPPGISRWQPATLASRSCCFSWLQWCVSFTWDVLPPSCRGHLGYSGEGLAHVFSCCAPQKGFLVLAHPLGSSSASSLRLRVLFSVEGERFLCAGLSSEEDSGRLTLQSPNSFDSSPMQQFSWLFFLIKLSGSVSLEMETVPLSGATCDVNLSLLQWEVGAFTDLHLVICWYFSLWIVHIICIESVC